MAQTTPPSVTTLPAAPSTANPTTFSALADAFIAALITFGTQLVALGSNVYNNAVDAYNNAVAASASQTAAAASSSTAMSSANFKGNWSAQTGAAAIPYAVAYANNFYQLKVNVADVTAHNPVTDTATWQIIGNPFAACMASIFINNNFGAFN